MDQPKRNEHNRDKILQTGMQLFARKGYHGTGLKEVLNACQVPKGSFYNYFDSKEQFAIDVLEYQYQQDDKKWERWDAMTSGDSLTRFRASLQLFIEDYEQDPNTSGCLLTNLMGEIGNASDSFRQIIDSSCNRVIDHIEKHFYDAQLEGSFRQDFSARALAQLFWDSWQGALLRTKVEASTQPLVDVADMLCSLFAPPITPTIKDRSNHEA
ncbi:TetR family transcriptional regulator C-terminal domain-containing protein [Amphritea sp. 1_MG-2023]|uniref:TetR/AcrR family transcriptional regulator n=1 Tax=Amphritea sp. 1_MG-2023 TaxID=3062670 RepID=UPI0026E464EE|nr:TetR/AcrR family transcriptional regulator [Amphritea sp. 1_MG-2023]MDO6563585.1 TetR family transcriptional regulator C-terminal domain-containing protein [Amphritea sp. 1_MG-2023]